MMGQMRLKPQVTPAVLAEALALAMPGAGAIDPRALQVAAILRTVLAGAQGTGGAAPPPVGFVGAMPERIATRGAGCWW